MRSVFIFCLIIVAIYAKDINIAVAANASSVVKEISKEYQKSHLGDKINITIGSSGKLAAQILNGAPYDLFLSANMEYPKKIANRLNLKLKPKIYAKGALAIFSTKIKNPNIDTLKNSNIHKIAIANDRSAPYGKATKELLENLKLYSKLKPKFIYGESIGQTLVFTLKAADIGIVAKSLLKDAKMSKYKEGINYNSIDSTLYTPIEQGALLLKDRAKEFYEYIFSNEAKNIFKKYGYIVDE